MCPRGVATSQSNQVQKTITAKLWLLLVGVNQYQDQKLPSLRYSAVDCQGLAEALTSATQQQFSQTEMVILHDFTQELPLLATVTTSLKKITTTAKPLDTILCYFSGHGIINPETQEAFLCLADTHKDNIQNTGLAVKELLQILGNSQAENQLIWLDACHSGGMTLRGVNPTPQLVEILQQRAAKTKGFYALLSCDTNQQSWEFSELGHGVFTYYLIEALKGKSANAQGLISAHGIYNYIFHKTLQYIDKINQQLRLINQQKRGKGETQLFSEYPLQTPKQIVESVGELILGKIPEMPASYPSRTALVIEGSNKSQMALDFSKILVSAGNFELHYLPLTVTTTSQDVQTEIQEFLNPTSKQQRTALLYLRGRLEETSTGEAALILLEEICLSRSWLRQQLRHSQVTQQIIILDCPETAISAVQEWVEDLQIGTGKGQCIIAGNSPKNNSEQFTEALITTLKTASQPAGLSVAGWITQLQVYLAGFLNLQIWLSGTQGVIEIIPAITGTSSHKAGLDLKICPYRGLRAFGEEDAQFFYGRESLTQQLINELAHKSFLAVVGASGSGKSSVVQAGLIAKLRLGKQLPGSDDWLIKSLRPGSRPLQTLSQKLANVRTTENEIFNSPPLLLEGVLYQGVEGFVYWLRNRIEPIIVLVIDQFEELFTLAPSEDRNRFLELILGALKYAPDRFKLVITLRADFIAPCLEVPELANLLQNSSVLVPPKLSDDDYHRVIVNPAEQVGLKVETGLVEILLQELNHSAGDLPLLEFVLEQLWEFRQEGELTLKAYQQQVAGIKGALERKAQAVYESLDQPAQECTRWIFLSLTQLGEGTEDTRRRVLKSELVVKKYPEQLIERTLQVLTTAKLVVVNLEEEIGTVKGAETQPLSPTGLVTIEVVHEILIRHWSTLRWWLEENRSKLRSQRQIEQAASLWKHHHEQADFLLQGIRLAEAEEIYIKYTDELSADIQHFIAACLEAREKQQLEQKKRLRQAQIAVAIMSILGISASVLGGFAYFQKQTAQFREISALNSSSAALLLSNQQLESVIASVKAGREFKQVFAPGKDIQIATVATLQQAIQQTQEVNRLQSHSQQVNTIKFSPNGKILASASDDRTVKIWDVQGKLITTITGFENRITAIAFSPDGGKILAVSAGNNIKIYTLDGKLIYDLVGHNDNITDINFSHDGKFLVSSSLDKTIKLWRVDGTLIKTWNADNGWVNTVSFSPDDKIIASGGEDNLVKIWKTEDGKLIKTLSGHQGGITKVKFSKNGKSIASASGDKTIKLWNSEGELLQTLAEHSEQINSISFSPDNQIIASASADNTIKLWRLDGSLLNTLKGHGEQVRDITFSPDGKFVASASADKTIKLWQVTVNPPQLDDINSVSFSKDKIFAAGWDGKVSILQKNQVTKFQAHKDIINALTFSPDHKILVTASADKSIKIWNSQNYQLLKTITGHENRVTSISISPDNQMLVSGSADKTVKLWRLTDGKLLKTFTGHTDEVTSVDFSPDSQIIASSSFDNTVKIWRINGTLVRDLTGHGLAISSIKFSPDGKIIASASWDNNIKLWNVNTGKLIHTLTGHNDGVTSLSFTTDGQILASGSADHTIKLWNVKTGTLINTLLGYANQVNSVSFSPDSKILISGGKNAGVMVWDLDLDDLLRKGCTRISHYLQNNPNVSQSDRTICNN
ncbi:eIF2A-related protein [Anabaena catenula]|uniref:Caspase family protein n=1 Tax=Anabaena catenula FACHB-362 TaxID=2692877 RepID=A0ABR8IWY1_9NOST|nr:caspase family protein [Anabaena catenula]MBD2690542.1 caspase family protein [Anabaena catenula FACHB-362]